MELVTPNLGTIFWMVIIFWLVVVILRKFAWKPILNAMNDREQSIENALSAAQSARKEMESLKAGNEQLLNEARQEREKVLNEAMKLKEKIVEEAKGLSEMGVKELNIIAQDTTRYGEDLYGR